MIFMRTVLGDAWRLAGEFERIAKLMPKGWTPAQQNEYMRLSALYVSCTTAMTLDQLRQWKQQTFDMPIQPAEGKGDNDVDV